MTREEAIVSLKSIIDTYETLEEKQVNSDVPLDGEDIQALGMAISALSAELCDDYISRKDAIQALKADGLEELCRSLGVYPWNVIKMIPSVQPINKWIPVSERLPEESGRYLTYIVNEYDEELQYIMTADYIARPTPIEGLSPWYVDDECASDNVVAWQPLPEPYKKGEADGK